MLADIAMHTTLFTLFNAITNTILSCNYIGISFPNKTPKYLGNQTGYFYRVLFSELCRLTQYYSTNMFVLQESIKLFPSLVVLVVVYLKSAIQTPYTQIDRCRCAELTLYTNFQLYGTRSLSN